MKNVLRNIWFVPFFFTTTAVLGTLSVIASLWTAKGARKFAPIWAKTTQKALGIELRIEGLEHLPKDGGGVIIASNHRSSADIGAVLAGLPLDICWVAKASLLKIPFLGWHLRRVHIPVARRAAGNTERFLQDGAKKIRDGAAVVIFPEGTRNRGCEKLLPFKRGTFLLARASGRPIVPVAILGSTDVWPIRQLLPGPGSVLMKIGAPIDPNGFDSEDLQGLADATREAMAALLPEPEAEPAGQPATPGHQGGKP